ncbi:MAG TPA: IS256 family transposase [Casimicrobiaceae bacterium]|nr:IS256 family transposase [Casimicrobiaceae bacterium]
MAAPASIDAIEWLRKQIEESAPDPLKTMLVEMVNVLMGAEVDAICGAGYRERSGERANSRNGYRERAWDTRVGTIGLQIPKLRQGSYFPTWLLEPRRRAEKALTAVVAEAYLLGVSTRKVEDLVQTLGIERLSKSQVSELAKELDGVVKSFRERPLAGPYKYVWLDALFVKCREDGRIVNVACLVAVGVNGDGRREILGLDVVAEEDGAGWLAFLRSLRARGLKGVELVISDAHAGLKDAIASVLRGAAWQRCRTHFIRNLLTKVPKAAHGIVATFVRTIFAQPDAESVRAQHARTVEQLQPRFAAAAKMLADAEEILAFTAFPKEHWRQIWSNNPQERLNREIRRRTDVVGIFPNRESIVRLVGAVLCELNDDWAVVRRYMTIAPREEVIDTKALVKKTAA